jgi:hypothetical protein
MSNKERHDAPLKTLVKIIKLINGYELWYRIEGQNRFETVLHKRGK